MLNKIYIMVVVFFAILLFSCADPNETVGDETSQSSAGKVPQWSPETVTFSDTDIDTDDYGGRVSFTRRTDKEEDITKYLLYAGTDSNTPVGEPIGSINKVYNLSSFEIDEDTKFMDYVSHFLIFSANENGLSETCAAVELIDSRPYTIESLKDPLGNVSFGTRVYIQDAVVTGVTDGRHCWISTVTSDGRYGGINVYHGDEFDSVAVGDRINVYGDYHDNWGNIQISTVTTSIHNNIISHGNPLPVPAMVLPADIATGGSSCEIYEGFLVTVENVSVTALDFGTSIPDFVVTGGLIVDDDIYSETPSVGDSYQSITGILENNYGEYRILPRGSEDLIK